MNKKIVLKANKSEIAKGVEFIRSVLLEKKVPKRDVASTLLTAEEALAKMIENCPDETGTVKLQVKSFLGNITIHMSGNGEKVQISDLKSVFDFSDEEDPEILSVKQNLVNKVLGDNITIGSRRGVNVVDIKVKVSKYRQLFLTLAAMVLGIMTGVIMKIWVPADITETISGNIFQSVYTMFLNALKMIVGPLVFFSIASSIADFGDLKALGRIVGKVIGCYLVTSVIAIGVGLLVFQILPIGNPSLRDAVGEASSALTSGEGMSLSIKDTIINIIPSDYISPFLNSNMLQLIFMAALLGIGASKLSEKESGFRRAIVSAYAVFSNITTMIISIMPIVVFCSMAKMVISMDTKNLLSVIAWVPVNYVGYLMMIAVYLLLLLIIGRINPLKFIRGFYPAMLTAYTLASSNATMPTSIKQCEKLGIAKQIYSFSIPLGATINMDGSCITQVITVLFIARIYGISLTGSAILTLVVAILALSVGAPGVPGSALICISMLLPQIGIPAEAVGLIVGIYMLASMGQTCTNVTGDAVVTTLVAKSEKMIDIEKYNGN
ncbi:MAG: dicarboxylate/amino acid:cation symporter [Eubacterium sp.]|nr:dicarboxylate/amino acid:cation symporter [Eubacterium sp.]